MEALLIRIDHFHDRTLYVSTVKSWLTELGISHGRLVTMGDFHLLFIEGTCEQNTTLLSYFPTKNVDTTAKNEPCTDRFIDVVGRKPINTPACKGFLEMNVLNASLLERLVVTDWHGDKAWLTDALSTPRTKALLKWKEDAKNARKDRRKRAAQDRDSERAAKKVKAEQDKLALETREAQGDGDADADEQDANTNSEEKEKEQIEKRVEKAKSLPPVAKKQAAAVASAQHGKPGRNAPSSKNAKKKQAKRDK